jgi:NDP-sugar pyrophosphorylase family protein
MDAIIIAGGIPKPGEPLYETTKGKPKAMLEIAGKSMIQWVLDALENSDKVDQIVISGLPENFALESNKTKAYIPTQNDMLENVKAGILKILELNPDAKQIIVASSDIPTIKPEMIDWLVDSCSDPDYDFYYNVVTRETMETRFPHSNRSFVRLKDVEVCGGDINVINSTAVTKNNELWGKIVAARKNAVKQAYLIGIDNLILLLLRAVDLEGAVKRVSKRMNIKAKVLLCPYAEMAMDVDKPHQLEMIRKDMEKQAS